MKSNWLWFAILSMSVSSPVLAALPRSAVSSMIISYYGMYTTSDPTCQTGLVAALPLSSTLHSVDLTTRPTLGNGSVANPIKCVVLITKNTISETWASGSYTGTTDANNDSQCNAGSSSALSYNVCRSVASLSYPAQIVADAAAAGLTLASSCAANPTGTEVMPVYISTYSACSGNTATDPASCTAGGSYPNAFAAPTASGDVHNGIQLTSPEAKGTIYFVVDPTSTIGGCGSVGPNCVSTGSGNCGAAFPPLFYFHN